MPEGTHDGGGEGASSKGNASQCVRRGQLDVERMTCGCTPALSVLIVVVVADSRESVQHGSLRTHCDFNTHHHRRSRCRVAAQSATSAHLDAHLNRVAFASHMSMMPLDTELGYAPPMVRHFSIFLDNRVGKLHDLLGGLHEEGAVEVRAISILDSSDYAVIRLLVDKPATARSLLEAKGFAVCETGVLVVELGNGREVHDVCKFLLAAELNIRFAYPTMPRSSGLPTIVLSTDDNTLAGQILRRKGFRLFGEADLQE